MTTGRLQFQVRGLYDRGCAWSDGPQFHDPSMAGDALRAWRPADVPELVRVTAVGDVAERGPDRDAWSQFAGDWYVSPEWPTPTRLPRASWTYNQDALDWSGHRPWVDCWETCPNAVWMLHAVRNVLPRVARVRVAVALAHGAADGLAPADPELLRKCLRGIEAQARAPRGLEPGAAGLGPLCDDARALLRSAAAFSGTSIESAYHAAAYAILTVENAHLVVSVAEAAVRARRRKPAPVPATPPKSAVHTVHATLPVDSLFAHLRRVQSHNVLAF